MNATTPTLWDKSFKMVFGGSGGVGKTTLLQRFMYNEFNPATPLTVGVAFNTCQIERQGRNIGLALWDLGGQERFRFIQSIYMEKSNAAFVAFDMSNLGTIGQVPDWVNMIRQYNDPSIPIVLVGTKMDLVSNEELENIHAIANQLVVDYGLYCYGPTSSLLKLNVDEIIYYMVDLLLYNDYYNNTSQAQA
ncbi:MAG: GTP-binding protein [Candidatus Lokiarchaeota archaeon]|nr:GTP-binding protein [Candidatus Lokiarchaeota archaeon]